MSVSTLVVNNQKFIFNGTFLHRIKYQEGRKQNRRVAISTHKERTALLEIFKNEDLSDMDRWKAVAEKWNNSINEIFFPLVSKNKV